MKPLTVRRAVVVCALGLTLAVATLAVVGTRGTPVRPPAVRSADAALTEALDRVLQRADKQAIHGVAMRPWTTPANDPASASLAAAACESIALRLARLPGLRVASCRSTDVGLAASLDDRALARLLAVEHVIKGELLPLADGLLHVRLALDRVGAGQRIWSLDERMTVDGLQALPARTSASAGAALGLRDTTQPPEPIAAHAYARFVQARELARRPSVDDRRTAVQLLDEVLATEPQHADSAFLRHSVKGWLLGNDGSGASVAQLDAARAAHVEEGVALAQRLVRADPQDVRAQWLLLGHEAEMRDLVAGFRRLDSMVALNPRLPGVLRLAARMHLHVGYVEEAGRLALAAAQLNALDAEAYEILGLVAGMQRRDEAMREFAAIARQLGHEGLGRLEVFDAWRRRDWPTVERAHIAWVSWGGQWPADWVPAWVLGLADPAQRERAARMLDAHPPATRQHFASYFVEYALLGETLRSAAVVATHAKLPPATWMQHLWWPELAAVRATPLFAPAMAELGFTRLWDVRGAPDRCRRDDGNAWSCR